MVSKILKQMLKHKPAAVIVMLLIVVGGYFIYQKLKSDKDEVRYLTAVAGKGTLISSVSGSGQVSVLNQIDIKTKVSGYVASIGVVNGQEVTTSTLLVVIDKSDAQKELRDARTALETAVLELNKLLAPADELDILQAENAVTTAKRNLEELINPSESTLIQAENSLISAQDNLIKLKFSQATSYQNALTAKQEAESNLAKAYEDAFNTIANTFLELPTLMTGLRDVLYSYGIADSEAGFSRVWNVSALKNSIDYNSQAKLQKFIDSAETNYQTARTKYDINLDNYKHTSRYSTRDVIELLLGETLETVRAMAETVKSEANMLDYWVDCRSGQDLRIFTKVATYQSSIKSYTSQINSYLSSLLSAQSSIENYQEDILDAERSLAELKQNQPLDLAAVERSVREKEDALDKLKNPEQHEIEAAQIAVKEKELALAELKAGADELDIRAKRIAVQQKQEALLAAQENLANHDVYAPFNGVIADIKVKKGESVSANSVFASLIGSQQIAEISLNEIDVAKVKAGQKATLTFDAVADLSITGKVAEIDTIGTVSQGVVTYDVKIAFDVTDERVKPGMSVSVNIITESKFNVLLVPITAVKTMEQNNYVEILADSQPQRKIVTTGSSNDTMIEIVSGLEEGEEIITQTISNTGLDSSSRTQSSQRSGPTGGMMIFR